MTRRLVDPACHEFAVNLNYDREGLSPWFAANRVVDDVGGGTTLEGVSIDAIDAECDVSIGYQDGSLVPPDDGETPAGTTVEFETIREPRIHVESRDAHGLRSIDYHLTPSWKGLTGETKDGRTVSINPPADLVNRDTDAVSIRAKGSNVEFDKYPEILREAADALGINSWYFGEGRFDTHETSNIQDAARYVRIDEGHSGPIHARDGPIVGLAHVLEDDRDGYRKLVQNDSDDRDHKKPGMYHTVTVGPKRVREVWPDHQLPIEAKHYFKTDYHERTDGLKNPKLEVAYQSSRWDDTVYADPEEVAALEEELDEWLYAILNDAGLDLRAGGDTYVSDEYFDAENDTTTASVVDLDLTEVRHEQESVVYRHLVDGMSPAEKESLEVLVTDGGDVSPSDIAEVTGRHQDTVYDALGRMHDLVDHQYGQVNLKSTYLSELVADALDQAEAAIERATMASAKAVNAANRGLDDRTSAFVAWCEKYGLNYSDDDRTTFELGQVEGADEVRKILREGLNRWEAMGRDPATFRTGKVRFRQETGNSYNYLPDDDRVKQNYADVFRFL